jgi:hypothetical protein
MNLTSSYKPSQPETAVSGVLRWMTDLKSIYFFLIVLIVHILLTIQGLDFNDEGFHAAFYQQIFTDPSSVQFGFWMWLTGIFGGLVLKLFPFLGLWGLRLAGALVLTLTIIIVYKLLKPYLNPGLLKISLLLLVLFKNEDAKNIYYNNFSALLYFLAAFLLFRGLVARRLWWICGAGFILALNIFTRIPNVLGLGMAIAIFYFGHLQKNSLSLQMKQLLFFLLGAVLAGLLVYTVMNALGHLQYFIASVKMLFGSSQEAQKGDGIGGAYGISRMFTRNLGEYLQSIRAAIMIILLIAGTGFLQYAVRGTSGWVRNVVKVFFAVIILAILFAVFKGWFNSFRLLLFFTGLGLLSAIWLFDKRVSTEIKLLILLGGYIALIHPFGSSEGISTVEIYSLWIVVPIAMDCLSQLRFGQLDSLLESNRGAYKLRLSVSTSHLRESAFWVMAIIALASLYNIIRYPYLCDRHSRLDMNTAIDNKWMKFVLTSPARARSLDELLDASEEYIHAGDRVLAYDCMPMYHFMTETRSYVKNPCIWFYNTSMFSKELSLAEKEHRLLPVLVQQNILTTGEGSGWPETLPATSYALLPRNQGKNAILERFKKEYQYKEVWTNKDFSIWIPGIKVSPNFNLNP